MKKEEFQKQLIDELNKHEVVIIENINKLLGNIPEKAKTLYLQIFPSQEGDGMFSIHARVDGPDLYVLNKALKDVAYLFDPKYTEAGIVPYIPTIDTMSVDYDVNILIVDCVAGWLEAVWKKIDKTMLLIPANITADEEASKFISIKLE